MYLDYESFVDCLIKSGYKKTNSCLTHETWVRGKDVVEIRVGDCTVYEVNGFLFGRLIYGNTKRVR